MIKTLRESKAKLSELVELASHGEDVVITVRGKPKARLTGIPATKPIDNAAWADELRALQERYSTGKTSLTVEEILEEHRQDRF